MVVHMNKTLFIVLSCSLILPSHVMASASTTWQTAANRMIGSIKTGVDTDSKSTTRPTYDAGNFIIKLKDYLNSSNPLTLICYAILHTTTVTSSSTILF